MSGGLPFAETISTTDITGTVDSPRKSKQNRGTSMNNDGKVVDLPRDYSLDPDGTAWSFEMAECDRKVTAAAIRLKDAQEEGRKVAINSGSSLMSVTIAHQNVTDAKLELVSKLLKRLITELEAGEVITRQDGAVQNL